MLESDHIIDVNGRTHLTSLWLDSPENPDSNFAALVGTRDGRVTFVRKITPGDLMCAQAPATVCAYRHGADGKHRLEVLSVDGNGVTKTTRSSVPSALDSAKLFAAPGGVGFVNTQFPGGPKDVRYTVRLITPKGITTVGCKRIKTNEASKIFDNIPTSTKGLSKC